MKTQDDLQKEGWIPDPKDIKFDKIWNLLLAIAFLIPITLGSFLFWVLIEI